MQKSSGKEHVRRPQALLHLAVGYSVPATAGLVFAARSSVARWRALYVEYGEAALEPALRRTCRATTMLVLILDNYIIHKCAAVKRWLRDNPEVSTDVFSLGESH